ncbi:Protein phosphatase 2C [Xylophilus ampelinus]|nr:Protein phosphatase 2C [Xylophilus ampelinus]
MNTASTRSPRAAEALTWRLAGHSVRGASHRRTGLPNQDALELWPDSGVDAPVAVAAVADGHGGARHFRSDVGAALGVAAMRDTLRQVGQVIAPLSGGAAAAAAHEALRALPAQLVQAWRDAAQAHLRVHPIRAEEWQGLHDAEGEAARESVEADPLLAYGATALGALATPAATVLVQLGDGDVLALASDGQVHRPVPVDARLGGNFTTSLCRSDAAADVRSAVLPHNPAPPALLLLCTDGYANSFRTDADFLRLAPDFLALIHAHGMSAVDAQLPAILEDASARGSGDDITLALLAAVPDDIPAVVGSAPPPYDTSGRRHNLRRQLRLARAGCAVLASALLTMVAWHWRDHWPEVLRRAPVLAAPIAVEPVRREARDRPGAREPGAGAEPLAPRPAAVDDPLLPRPPRTGAGPAGAPRPDAGAPSALHIAGSQARARRTAHGVEVTVDASALPLPDTGCLLQASAWAARSTHPASTSELALPPGHADAMRRTLLLGWPTDKASAKALQAVGATFSVEVRCAHWLMARSDRLPIAS